MRRDVLLHLGNFAEIFLVRLFLASTSSEPRQAEPKLSHCHLALEHQSATDESRPLIRIQVHPVRHPVPSTVLPHDMEKY